MQPSFILTEANLQQDNQLPPWIQYIFLMGQLWHGAPNRRGSKISRCQLLFSTQCETIIAQPTIDKCSEPLTLPLRKSWNPPGTFSWRSTRLALSSRACKRQQF